jgi:hypothetical protein
MVLGSTSTIGTAIHLSLPFTALSTISHAALWARWTDAGTNDFMPFCFLASTTHAGTVAIGVGGVAVSPSSTSPFTWTTGDSIQMAGTYEIS